MLAWYGRVFHWRHCIRDLHQCTLEGDGPVLELSAQFQAKIDHASDAAAAAKEATTDKNDTRHRLEAELRRLVRQIKSHRGYTKKQGDALGIEGPEYTVDLSTAKPDLAGVDQTGGVVSLTFTLYKSDGVNIYGQREGDSDWVLVGRAVTSPYMDERPLLQPGKPELRRYAAVYMLKAKQVGAFSDDLVINCAP